jgi:hypothetical protein
VQRRKLSYPGRRFAHVFDGGGFGVAVTATPLDVAPWAVEFLPPGVVERPTRLGEMMPAAARTDAEIAVELQRVQQMEARLAAYTAELIAELAARRPDTLDRQIGEPGAASPDWLPCAGREAAPGVSEFFADELAIILNCSRAAATRLADSAALLTERLPATWAALADGQLDWPRARGLAAELMDPARDVEPCVLAEVEAAVLPRAHELSIRGLQAAARKELLRRDAAAADRRRAQNERAADVVVRPARDGMSELASFLPQPLSAAIWGTVDAYARMAQADGDPRSIGQLRVGVLADLVLRPWDTSRPAVTAHITVVAPMETLSAGAAGHDACVVGHGPRPGMTLRDGCGCGEPAEVEGQPITAAQLRALLEQLDVLCPGGLQVPAGGTLGIALVDPMSGALRAAVTRVELERMVRRGCRDHPDGDCPCPVLDRPSPVDRYRPAPAQYRHVRTRDRTCRHPGCRNGAGWSDLDHVIPHADGGATDCANLCCLCRRHHRLKTHAAGWRFAMTADGVLTVTTPSGVTRTTRPPGLREIASDPPGPDDPPLF